MESSIGTLFRLNGLFVLTFYVGLCFSAKADEESQMVRGVEVPIYNEQGEVIRQMFGDSATFKPDGSADIVNMRIEFYRQGETNLVVRAPACRYDQHVGTAESDSSVEITGKGMRVTGRGFEWDNAQERFIIHHEARVELRRRAETLKLGDEE